MTFAQHLYCTRLNLELPMGENFDSNSWVPAIKREGSNTIQFDLIYFGKYLNSMENFIAQEALENSEMYESFGSEWGDKEVIEYLKEFNPQTLRTSLFISIYSRVESALDKICKTTAKARKLKIGLTDLKGQGIERAMLYLMKVVGIEVTLA